LLLVCLPRRATPLNCGDLLNASTTPGSGKRLASRKRVALDEPPGSEMDNPQPNPKALSWLGVFGSQTRWRWGALSKNRGLIRDSRHGAARHQEKRRYRRSLNHKLCRLGIGRCYFLTRSAPFEKSKFLGSRGSMVARLKLKEIDGRAPPGVGGSAPESRPARAGGQPGTVC
jgi:hypothetical protein